MEIRDFLKIEVDLRICIKANHLWIIEDGFGIDIDGKEIFSHYSRLGRKDLNLCQGCSFESEIGFANILRFGVSIYGGTRDYRDNTFDKSEILYMEILIIIRSWYGSYTFRKAPKGIFLL